MQDSEQHLVVAESRQSLALRCLTRRDRATGCRRNSAQYSVAVVLSMLLLACSGGSDAPITGGGPFPQAAAVLEFAAGTPRALRRAETTSITVVERLATGAETPIDPNAVTWTVVPDGGRARVVTPGVIHADSVGAVEIRASIGARSATWRLSIEPNPRRQLELTGFAPDTVDAADTLRLGLRERLQSGAVDTVAPSAQRWRVVEGTASVMAGAGAWLIAPRGTGRLVLAGSEGADTVLVALTVVATRVVGLAIATGTLERVSAGDTLTVSILGYFGDGRSAPVAADRFMWSVTPTGASGTGGAGIPVARIEVPGRVVAMRDGSVIVRATPLPGTGLPAIALAHSLVVATSQAARLTWGSGLPGRLYPGEVRTVTLSVYGADGHPVARPVTVASADSGRVQVQYTPVAGAPRADGVVGRVTFTPRVAVNARIRVTVRVDSIVRVVDVYPGPPAAIPLVHQAGPTHSTVGDTLLLPTALYGLGTVLQPDGSWRGSALRGGTGVRWRSTTGVYEVGDDGVSAVARRAGTDTMETVLIARLSDLYTDTLPVRLVVVAHTVTVNPFVFEFDASVPAGIRSEMMTIGREFARLFRSRPTHATTSITTPGAQTCAGYNPNVTTLEQQRDAIVIRVRVEALRAGNGTGRQCIRRAGPSEASAAALQTWVGEIALDTSLVDATRVPRSSLRTVLGHELFHALTVNGLSPLMPQHYDPVRSEFGGPNAMAAYARAGGAGPVPMALGGVHLDDRTFAALSDPLTGFVRLPLAELMAEHPGFALGLTRLSAALLADLGYDVDLDRVTGYRLPALVLEDLRARFEAASAGASAASLESSLRQAVTRRSKQPH